MSESPTQTPVLRRARIACKACNARRVKCDAADGIPCWHCRTRSTACELIESKRGRYIRQKQPKQPSRLTHQRTRQAASDAAIQHHHDAPSAIQVDATDEACTISAVDEGGNDEGTNIQPQFMPAVRTIPAQQSSQFAPDARSCHLKNTLSLSYILDMVQYANESDLGPFKLDPRTFVDQSIPTSESRISEHVSLQAALVMPSRDVSDQLIRSFFENFHPAYPVIDKHLFASLYRQGKASPLILHAIYMVALTCGPEDLVQAAGYTDRTTARKAHYLRAKTLYDYDYETDDTNVAAALHLLSFWWLGPDDQKDSWYWQGCSVTLVQSLGMHRSLARRELNPRLRSLWKRIWWSIYIRDRHAAAALGRPCRIRDEDCDVEPPSEEDLLIDADADEQLIPAQDPCHISYFLEISKLSIILGDIVIGEFSPRRPAIERFDTASTIQRLEHWQSQLPTALHNNSSDKSMGAPFWASMLDASYQSACILLFCPKMTEFQSPSHDKRDARARMAADVITRTAEDLLASGTMHYAQLHLVPSLFSALSIHSLVVYRMGAVQRQLAENKSRQCILALSELAKIWPVGMWIVRSFLNLMRRLTSKGSAAIEPRRARVASEMEINSRGDPAFTDVYASSTHPATSVLETPTTSYDSNFTSRTMYTPSSPATNTVVSNFTQPQIGPDYFSGAADQFVHDSVWLGYLDHGLDMDFLQRQLDSVFSIASDTSEKKNTPPPTDDDGS
ncbi:fungal-specific transcription factor domain-containing protein [Ilyonectria destructans]|nr:fungal-specific transcription factor domain-containing protein [Ilyonectria destructans]